MLEINAEDSGVQLLAPVNAKGNGLRGAVVGSGRGVHAFEEEEKRGQQCGEVEESHDLHQVVVEELCRVQAMLDVLLQLEDLLLTLGQAMNGERLLLPATTSTETGGVVEDGRQTATRRLTSQTAAVQYTLHASSSCAAVSCCT